MMEKKRTKNSLILGAKEPKRARVAAKGEKKSLRLRYPMKRRRNLLGSPRSEDPEYLQGQKNVRFLTLIGKTGGGGLSPGELKGKNQGDRC